MKLLSQFSNKYNNITYKTYELENGIKLLYLDNPATIDFDFAFVFKAGSSFEIQENVPRGTAHFLEHMLLNPNSVFKTKTDIDRFEQGDRKRPAIYTNAYTTRKNIYFTCHSNLQASQRVLERMESVIEFSKRKFSNSIEKERGIILAEKSRKIKKEKDPALMNLEFLFKGIQNEFTSDILGENSDIKKININDLEKFFKNRFVSGNCVLAIQSNGDLKKTEIDKIEKISKKIPIRIFEKHREIVLENKWKVGTFVDKRAMGISISFMYFDKIKKKIDYKQYAIEHIYAKLLNWLAYDILREKMSLIYSFSPFKIGYLSFDYDIHGFRFTTENGKAEKMLKELYTLLYTTSFNFLKSKKGKEWFEDVISTYIFPRTSTFDNELAENSIAPLLEESEIFNSNIAVREGKKITIEDIQKYHTKRLSIAPHIWIESNMSKSQMNTIVNNSPFAKRFY